jgi:hypothetical protein
MRKKKLKLNELRIQSFVTSPGRSSMATLRGGSDAAQGCVQKLVQNVTGVVTGLAGNSEVSCPEPVTLIAFNCVPTEDTGLGMCLCKATEMCTGAAGC